LSPNIPQRDLSVSAGSSSKKGSDTLARFMYNVRMANEKQSAKPAVRAFVIGVALITVFTAGFLLLRTNNQKDRPGANLERVVINQAANVLLYLPLYIAQDKGFFEQEGILVEIVTGGGDSQAFAAVLSGSADIAQGDPMMVPISRAQGGPGKIVGTVVSRVAFWGVTLKDQVPEIRDPSQFRNIRVVTYPAPNTIYALQKRNLEKGKLTEEDSPIIQAQFGHELAPIFAGQAEVAMTLEPVVSQALANGARVVFSFPEQYGEFALTGLITTEDKIKSNPRRIRSVVRGIQAALNYAHTDPEGAVAVAMKRFPDVPKGVLRAAVLRMLSEGTLPKDVSVSDKGYMEAMRVRRDIGDLAKDISFLEAVDNTFASEATLRSVRP